VFKKKKGQVGWGERLLGGENLSHQTSGALLKKYGGWGSGGKMRNEMERKRVMRKRKSLEDGETSKGRTGGGLVWGATEFNGRWKQSIQVVYV